MLLTIVVSLVSVSTTYNMTMNTLSVTVQQATEIAALNLTMQLDIFRMVLKETMLQPAFADVILNKQEIQDILEARTEEYYALVSFADTQGNDIVTGKNIGGEEFFQRALSGENYISNAFSNGENMVYAYAIPAVFDEKTIGVMYMTPDATYFNGQINQSAIGETGVAYIIDSDARIVLKDDIEQVKQGYRSADHVADNPKLAGVANMEADAALGAVGFSSFKEQGVSKIAGYAPVANTDGWTFVSTANSSEFLGKLYYAIAFTVGCCILIALISVLLLVKTTNKFINPIKLCIDRISTLAKGDLSTPVPQINSDDETGQLAQSTNVIVQALSKLIQDEEYVLGQMSQGDFTVESKCAETYMKDFAPLLTAMTTISKNMQSTLFKIDSASVQVTNSSLQVSNTSQTLAQGSSEQAASLQEISETMTYISDHVSSSVKKAQNAKDFSMQTGLEVKRGNEQMVEMKEAMDNISSSSNEISKIIKSIQDLAFQTNILALNASVEAARAGKAGSGFAVVAEEVRNLANKSALNAKNTEELISKTLTDVANGTRITAQTATSLAKIVDGVTHTIDLVSEIAETMDNQSSEVAKITSTVNEISNVIHSTSAISQESAATSEELATQAQVLRALVSEFKIN